MANESPDFEGGVSTAGSEFGAVDDPALGGTGDPGTTGNWYTGAWGDNIASTAEHGVALPPDTLAKYGYTPKSTDFGQQFNSQYQINLLDPSTGEPKIQDVGLKDLGPGRHTGKGIDLMYRTAREYGQNYNTGGKVAFQIVPRASLAGQSEETPQGQAAAQPSPAPAWSEIQSSGTFQQLQPEQQQQVLDKWHQDTYDYANSHKDFSADARNALYDFYQQQKQELQPKPVDVGQEVGRYAQQVAGAANVAATKADVGAYQGAVNAGDQQPVDVFGAIPPEAAKAAEQARTEFSQKQLDQLQPRLQQQEKALQAQGKPMPGAYEIGGSAPLVAAGLVAAPMGPAATGLVAAQQMSSQEYQQAYQEAGRLLQQQHPDWDAMRIRSAADGVAQEAGKYAALGGAALGVTGAKLPIENIVGRILGGASVGGITQGAIGGGMQAGENLAMQKVDPNRPLMQGVPEAALQQGIAGGVLGGVGGIHGEAKAPEQEVRNIPVEAPQRPVQPSEPSAAVPRPPEPQTQPQAQPEAPLIQRLQEQGHQVVPFHEQYAKVAGGEPANPTEEALLNAIPKSTNVVVADKPVQFGEGPNDILDMHKMGVAGAYHVDSNTILLRNDATDPKMTLLHEGLHSILEGHQYDPDIVSSWNEARRNAGKIGNLPQAVQYALSNPDEHIAAAMSDPIYQAFIGPKAMQDITNAVKRIAGIDPRDPEANAVVRSALAPMVNSPSQTFGTRVANSVQSIWKSGLGMLKTVSPDLATRMQNWRMERALQIGKVNQLQEKWKQLLKTNPNLDNEIDMLGQQSLGVGIRPNQVMSPEAAEWLKIANNGLYREHGDLMRSLGGQVSLGGGKTRPFVGAPPYVTPFPRILRPDYAEMLRGQMTDKQGNLLPIAQRIYSEGQQAIDRNTGKPFWSNPEEFLAKAQEYRNMSVAEGNGPRLSGIERGRELDFPDRFYTFGGNAMIDRLYKEADSLARIKSFGQTFSGTGDAFQKDLTRIAQDPSIPEAKRGQAQNIIKTLQGYAYGGEPMGPMARFIKGASSVGFAANPFTSSKIGLGMTANVLSRYGVPRTMIAALHNLFHMPEVHDLLSRTDMLANVDRNALANDLYANSPSSGHNIVGQAMKWSGHQLSQNYGRALTATAARIQLEGKYIPALQIDPMLKSALAREAAQEIDRLGLDYREFAQKDVPRELRDKYVQGQTMALQTNYYPERYPTWSNTPPGRMMGQFGHWGYTASESLTNNYVRPFAEAVGSKDFALAGRYLGRVLQMGIGVIAGAEGYNMLKTAFGRPDQQANWQELWQGLVEHKPMFAKMMMERIKEDIIASPVVGLFGDYYNKLRGLFKGEATNASTSFDPLSPAGIGYFKAATDVLNKAAQQGWRLSGKQLAQEFMKQFSEYRELYGVAARAGAPVPGGAEVKGYDERNFARRSLDLYRKLYTHEKVYGTYVTGPNKPYEDDIQDALYRGDSAAAKQLADKMMKERGLTPKELSSALTRSIGAQAPIPTGPERAAFFKAAPEFLTQQERQRIVDIDKRYSDTALKAGLIKRAVGEKASARGHR